MRQEQPPLPLPLGLASRGGRLEQPADHPLEIHQRLVLPVLVVDVVEDDRRYECYFRFDRVGLVTEPRQDVVPLRRETFVHQLEAAAHLEGALERGRSVKGLGHRSNEWMDGR